MNTTIIVQNKLKNQTEVLITKLKLASRLTFLKSKPLGEHFDSKVYLIMKVYLFI